MNINQFKPLKRYNLLKYGHKNLMTSPHPPHVPNTRRIPENYLKPKKIDLVQSKRPLILSYQILSLEH